VPPRNTEGVQSNGGTGAVVFLAHLAVRLRRHFIGELLVGVVQSKILAMVAAAVIGALLRQ